MGIKEPSFTLGVEEEYLLVDKETRSLVIDPPASLMAEAKEKCGTQVASELLRSQIEIGTKVCSNIQEAHERGLMELDTYNAWLNFLSTTLGMPGGKMWW